MPQTFDSFVPYTRPRFSNISGRDDPLGLDDDDKLDTSYHLQGQSRFMEREGPQGQTSYSHMMVGEGTDDSVL